jgi:hypothetical protein
MSEKLELYKQTKARIVAEMEQNEQHKDLFSQYSAHSVKLFIEHYAGHKANLEVYGDFTKYQERKLMDEWQAGAWDCLEQIQHKKLFDIGLRWLAEEVRDLPEIELTVDFDLVSDHVLEYDGRPVGGIEPGGEPVGAQESGHVDVVEHQPAAGELGGVNDGRLERVLSAHNVGGGASGSEAAGCERSATSDCGG